MVPQASDLDFECTRFEWWDVNDGETYVLFVQSFYIDADDYECVVINESQDTENTVSSTQIIKREIKL
jgi:hypothetical protein